MNNRLEILNKIESGELAPEAGLALLNALDAAAEQPSPAPTPEASAPAVEVIPPVAHKDEMPEADRPDFSRFRIISWILFAAFLILTVLSANWMIQGWQAHAFGWGFWLSWIPFAIGILGMATSLNARWLHLRVTENENGKQKNIRISMPLPLGIASWLLRANPGWLPQEMRDKNIGETLADLNKGITRDQPFYLEVDEEDEHVEIYIG